MYTYTLSIFYLKLVNFFSFTFLSIEKVIFCPKLRYFIIHLYKSDYPKKSCANALV